MYANNYQQRAMRTAGKFTQWERLQNATLGMCGEAGEFADLLKKVLFQGLPQAEAEPRLAEELGDLLWYVAHACTALGLDLSAVMQANLDKLWERYPDGFVPRFAGKEATE